MAITTGTFPIFYQDGLKKRKKFARGGRNFFKEAGKQIVKGVGHVADVAGVIPGVGKIAKPVSAVTKGIRTTFKFKNGGINSKRHINDVNRGQGGIPIKEDKIKLASGGLNNMMYNTNYNNNPVGATGYFNNSIPIPNTYKKGGKATCEKKVKSLAKQGNLHPEFMEKMKSMHKTGRLTLSSAKALAKKYGHNHAEQHHFVGKIVDMWNKYSPKAKEVFEKGKKYAGKAHDFYTKHKDTVNKGIDTVSRGKEWGKKLKSGLDSADETVKSARNKYGFKKGGHVKNQVKNFGSGSSFTLTKGTHKSKKPFNFESGSGLRNSKRNVTFTKF